MTDLTTRYLGLALRNPVVASAGPLTGRLDALRDLEEAGVGAVVLPSLFEEEVVEESQALQGLLAQGTESYAEATTYLPDLGELHGGYLVGAGPHLRLVEQAKAALSVPVIASINGTTSSGWIRYATELADAGADAIECNLYVVAADVGDTAAEVEDRAAEIVRTVVDAVDVPVAVKLSPYFTAFAHVAARLLDAGAAGLVLFNRFYQPDIDLDTLEVAPTVDLSTSSDLRLPLRWVAILHGRVQGSLALTGGVQRSDDVVKAVLAGADVVMTTSALLRHGAGHVRAFVDGLAAWLDEREYVSVDQARGSVSQLNVADPSRFERANYVEILRRYSAEFEPQPR